MNLLLTGIMVTGIVLGGKAGSEITAEDATRTLQHPAALSVHALAILQLEAGLIDETDLLYGKAVEGTCLARDYFGLEDYYDCHAHLDSP